MGRLIRLLSGIFVGIILLLVLWQLLNIPAGVDTSEGCKTNLCCEKCTETEVTGIIDGDTFYSTGGKIRLFGVDTPEHGERCFSEAAELLEALAGTKVRVEKGPRSIDSYGRRLFYVYTLDGESIDERLLREGLATAWIRDGQHVDVLRTVQDYARDNGIGCLWK